MSEPVTETHVNSCCGMELSVTLSDGSEIKREATPVELALNEYLERVLSEDLHGVWHRFQEVLETATDCHDRDTKAEAFADAHPEWVAWAGCDNDRFMSSSLLLIRHGTGDHHMGTSVVLLDQGCEHMPTFFLYPGHAKSLLYALAQSQPGLVTLPEYARTVDTEDFLARHARKPSSFDAYLGRWRTKPWYAEHGHVERLEAIERGETG